jgi:GSCFA family
MKFRTTIKEIPSGIKLGYQNSILTLGSCFSEEIGKKLKYYRFNTLSNPFGTLYNPRVIEKIIELSLSGTSSGFEETLFKKEEQWYSYWFHSSVKAQTKSDLKDLIRIKGAELMDTLSRDPILILTLGTARVYFSVDSQREIGNCHKLPAKEFEDRLLTAEEISQSIQKGISKLQGKFNDLKVIITVSPVRHLKDGMVENQRSKARLVLAAEILCSNLREVHYFPAYEILLDDLRDYRFYAEDLLHPNQLGIDYIWEKFKSSFFNEPTREKLKSIGRIRKGINHSPFDRQSPQYIEFLKKLLAEASQPGISNLMAQDIDELKKRIG